MKTVIEMAREATLLDSRDDWSSVPNEYRDAINAFAELVRADERNSWPAEMQAMERQVNILTDALNDRQRWFDALEAQHKQAILAERESVVKAVEEFARKWWKIHCDSNLHYSSTLKAHQDFCALQAAIRARGNT